MAVYTNSSLFLSDDDDIHLNHHHHHRASSHSTDDRHEATISQLNQDLQSLQIELSTCPLPTTSSEQDLDLLEHRQLLETRIVSIQEELGRLNMGSALSPAVVISDDDENEQNTNDHLSRPIMISQASGPPNASTKKRKLEEQLDPDSNKPRDNKSRKIHTPDASSSATSTGSSSSTSKTSVVERWV